MEDLKKIKTEELMEHLVKQTSAYFQMHEQGATEKEFENCKLFLTAIQEEIKTRLYKDHPSKRTGPVVLSE